MPASHKHYTQVFQDSLAASDEELLRWISASPSGKRTVRSDRAWIVLGQRGWDANEILDGRKASNQDTKP